MGRMFSSFTMGMVIGAIGGLLDRHFSFVSCLSSKKPRPQNAPAATHI